jgi:hypothetical protein
MVWRQGKSYSEDLRARVLVAIDGGMAAREKEPADHRANLVLSMNPSWLSGALLPNRCRQVRVVGQATSG